MVIESQSQMLFARITAVVAGFIAYALIQAISLSYLIPVFFIVPVAVLTYRGILARSIRRKKVISQPFPEDWRFFLENRVRFYRELTEDDKEHYEELVQIFLSEQHISGVDPVVVDDEIRLLVASGAVTLVFYRSEWEYNTFRDILIYEDAFDLESYEISEDKEFAGMVGTQIPIILSLKHLREGFRHSGDGFNVAYHEFAHIVDLHDVGDQTNPLHGIFAQALTKNEMKKIMKGKSVLRQYGAQNEAEFFAVATEFFYEKPSILFAHHPDLYRNMVMIFNYDPLLKRPPVVKEETE